MYLLKGNTSILAAFVIVFCFGVLTVTHAKERNAQEKPAMPDVSAYTLVQKNVTPSLQVATVVELPLNIQYGRKDFEVVDTVKHIAVPYLYTEDIRTQASYPTVSSEVSILNVQKLSDGNVDDFVDIDVQTDTVETTAELGFEYARPITSTSFSAFLQEFSQLPRTISISVLNNNTEKVIVAQTQMMGETMNFPETTSSTWIVRFTLIQPLRMSEVVFSDSNAERTRAQNIRFLAQPNTMYEVYAAPDRFVMNSTSESGSLQDDTDVRKLDKGVFEKNPAYKQADVDEDGILDVNDNCVRIANADQQDVNANKVGDVCEDFDKDGIINNLDNCKSLPNYAQIDADNDGMGDACDSEESRITEKYQWLPWLAITAVVLVVLGLFASAIRREKQS